MEQTYRSQILDHLGLVAGMFDELGLGAVVDKATHHNPEMRDLTVGEAVKARMLHGLGLINQALSLVPRCFEPKPTSRLMTPRVIPAQLHADALGRAWDTLYDYGVTALSRLMAATAAKRLGFAPPCAHLERTSLPVAGRDNSHQAPDEQVVPIPRGSRRDHRPDRNQGMRECIVAPQAGSPGLRQPLRGTRHAGQAFHHIVKEPMAHLPTPYGPTSVVAARALSRDANRPQLATTQLTWIPRVPATGREAHAALAHADLPGMQPLPEG